MGIAVFLELLATLGSARSPSRGGRSLFVRPLQLRGCARLTTFRIDGKMHGISKNAFKKCMEAAPIALCDEDCARSLDSHLNVSNFEQADA
jgi:hypothetical protein